MISDDGLELEEAVQGVLVKSEFLVAKAEIVQGLDARGVVLQCHVVQFLGLFGISAGEGAVGEINEGRRVVTIGILGQFGIFLALIILMLKSRLV